MLTYFFSPIATATDFVDIVIEEVDVFAKDAGIGWSHLNSPPVHIPNAVVKSTIILKEVDVFAKDAGIAGAASTARQYLSSARS